MSSAKKTLHSINDKEQNQDLPICSRITSQLPQFRDYSTQESLWIPQRPVQFRLSEVSGCFIDRSNWKWRSANWEDLLPSLSDYLFYLSLQECRIQSAWVDWRGCTNIWGRWISIRLDSNPQQQDGIKRLYAEWRDSRLDSQTTCCKVVVWLDTMI